MEWIKNKKWENVDTEFKYFLEPNCVRGSRLFVLVCSNQGSNSKIFKTRKYNLPKSTTKNYNISIEKALWPTHWFRYKTIIRN